MERKKTEEIALTVKEMDGKSWKVIIEFILNKVVEIFKGDRTIKIVQFNLEPLLLIFVTTGAGAFEGLKSNGVLDGAPIGFLSNMKARLKKRGIPVSVGRGSHYPSSTDELEGKKVKRYIYFERE